MESELEDVVRVTGGHIVLVVVETNQLVVPNVVIADLDLRLECRLFVKKSVTTDTQGLLVKEVTVNTIPAQD